jgi:uncharacterized lipoprotein YddW (UPF0748 family)
MRALLVLAVTIAVASDAAASPLDAKAPSAEVRALWVDGFHAGIRSQAEVNELVKNAKRVRFNTLFVQVRRRGDSLYKGGLEPALDDPNYSKDFDGLAAVLEAGHREGLKVHAWINAMPIWRDEPAPKDPRHIFNQHGLTQTGASDWLTRSREGERKFPVGYFLDPGHPAVQDHLVSVYMDIVRRYAVDGIHFDYIRYPETEPRLPRGSNVGYNEVSVARFQRATGRTDVPAPDDEAWTQWRRRQVTELVRRVSIEARAINPRIEVSASTIAWGAPPTSLEDFANVAPMQRIFQNWQSWLVEGTLDMAVPMNYAREHDPRVKEWFNGWIAWEKKHKADRSLAVGIGAYLNTKEAVLAQASRVRAANGKHRADGMSFYSYFRPSAPPTAVVPVTAPGAPPAEPTTEADPSSDRLDFVSAGTDGGTGLFTNEATVPAMDWIKKPERGFIAGRLVDAEGKAIDAASVRIKRKGWFRRAQLVTTDGNGWFGLTRQKPGTYTVRVVSGGKDAGSQVTVEVQAGAVTKLKDPLVGSVSR